MELLNPNSPSFDYTRSDPKSVNTVVSKHRIIEVGKFVSGIVDLRRYSNIYSTSANLGNLQTRGPTGQCNIIKNIPCDDDCGTTIFDTMTAPRDDTDDTRQMFEVVDFELTDACGDAVKLGYHGHIVFTGVSVKPDTSKSVLLLSTKHDLV